MGIIGTGGVTIINNGSASTNPDGSNTPVYFADCATTLALPACTYNNGTLGVGATLTANANGALTTTYTDGVALSIGDIILVWQQTSKLQNGLYEITQIGTVSTPWILTRLAIYDTTAEVYPSQVNILYGTVYATKYFLQQTENPTIGTSSLVYVTVTAPSSSTINQYLQLVDTYTTSALPTCTYTPNASATTPALNAYLNATVNGAFPTLNGVAPFQYMKVLVTGQADPKQNGDYKLQNVGSASSTWRLSRISYTAPQLYPTWWGIYQGTGRGLIFEQTTSTLTTATIGVSGNIVFVQVSSAGLTYFTEAQATTGTNATTYVDSLTAVSSITNTDFSIIPKGAGAFQLALPNGLATGGNKRGLYAVDLQLGRDLATQVSSGVYSFTAGYANIASGIVACAIGQGNIASGTNSIGIGYLNTASGNYSFCGGGQSNIASGLYSVAFGNLCSSIGAASFTFGQSNTANGVFSVCLGSQNTTGNNASFAIGTGNFASGGNYSGAIGYLCQATQESAFAIGQSNYSYGRSSFTLGENNTADGSYSITVGFNGSSLSLKNKFTLGGGAFGVRGDSQLGILPLRSRTTDATSTILTTDYSSPSTTNQLILQNNQLITFTGQIQGKKTGTTELGVWNISGVIVRGATAGTTTLTVSNVSVVTNASGWGTPTLTADTVNGGLKVTVIGLLATNIQWGCRIDTVETIY